MANLYASAVGVSVLQLKKIPSRPAELNGAIRACRLPAGFAAKAPLQKAYGRYGEITDIEVRSADEATIYFATREAAKKALTFDPKALGLGADSFVCFEYNDRPYDDRGWCTFEDAVSIEFLGRSAKPGNTAMRMAMAGPKRAKVYQIGGGADPVAAAPSGPQDVNTVQRHLEAATFIGKGDRKLVLDMYKHFQLEAAKAASLCAAHDSLHAGVSARQVLAMENKVSALQRHNH